MNFNFRVTNDRLILIGNKNAYAGNKNYYGCRFEFSDEWKNTAQYAVFKYGGSYFGPIAISGSTCKIPYDVLKTAGSFCVGVYGVDSANTMCISTGWQEITVGAGSYSEGATVPETPSEDLWSQYLEAMQKSLDNAVPYIGENGNWYVFDAQSGEYTDTDIKAEGHTHANASILDGISSDTIKTWNGKQDGFSAGAGLTLDKGILSVSDYHEIDSLTINEDEVGIVEITKNMSDLSKIAVFLKVPASTVKASISVVINGVHHVASMMNCVSESSITYCSARVFKDYSWWGISVAGNGGNDCKNAYMRTVQDASRCQINNFKLVSTGIIPKGTAIMILGA